MSLYLDMFDGIASDHVWCHCIWICLVSLYLDVFDVIVFGHV